MKNSSIDTLFSNRGGIVYWCDPCPGLNSNGEKVTVNVELSATVDDCIRMSRAACPVSPDARNDFDAFLDFVAINFASEESMLKKS